MQIFAPGHGGDGHQPPGDARNLPFGKKTKKRKLRVPEARRLLEQQEAEKLVDNDAVVREALERVQSSGIVFIDEIDKVAGPGGWPASTAPTSRAAACSAICCRWSKDRR